MNLLTKTELAKKMGFKSIRTIDKYVAAGMPKQQPLGKGSTIKFDLADVLLWFKHETPAPVKPKTEEDEFQKGYK